MYFSLFDFLTQTLISSDFTIRIIQFEIEVIKNVIQ